MLRKQILLDKTLAKELEAIAKNHGMSQSKLIRKLLRQSLSLKSGRAKQKVASNYLYELGEFSFKNPRIDGFKEIFSVGGKTTEIKIVDDKLFRYFLKNKKFPSEVKHKILSISNEIKKFSKTQKLVVRRAYVVPGLENPPGPRFLGLDPEEISEAIKKIYQFAIKQKYPAKKSSQICVFFYPFADPEPFEFPLKKNRILPYGGYAVPLNKKASRVEVLATWGNNEGVQSFEAIDKYIVNTQKKIILKKEIPQKTKMLCTTRKSQSTKTPVPQDKQFEQILSDLEILEIARVVKELTKKYGLRRVEFSFDGKESIIFNESIPYKILSKKGMSINKQGLVITVKSENDVKKLRSLPKSKVNRTIIYIDKSIVQNRSYDVLNSVASLTRKFTILYPGLSATAHAMRVLNDFGHTAIVVGNKTFKKGDQVTIKNKGSDVNITVKPKRVIEQLVVKLFDASLYNLEMIGGKAMNLSILKTKGFNVPPGIVLTTNFFDKIWKKEKGLEQLWYKILASIKLDKKYAVRSSANVEDQSHHSFAGQFQTFLNVGKNQVKRKSLCVAKSAFGSKIKKYLDSASIKYPVKMAVIIQEMIDSQKAGVVFCKDLQTQNKDIVVIDAAMGLGEKVVNGTAKTYRITYSKSKDDIVKTQGEKILSSSEIASLVEMALSVESLMGKPQDIEWTIDHDGLIWLLQARPLK